MDDEFKSKYERYKMVVKVWEQGFKKKAGRIPSKVCLFSLKFRIFYKCLDL